MDFKCEKICKSYSQGALSVDAVHPASMEFSTGMHIITGKSGSGKTTLLNMLAGLEKPDSGKVIYNKKSIYNLSDTKQSDLRLKYFGFIFQFFNIIPELSVYDNIGLSTYIGTDISDDRITKISKELSIYRLLDRMPNDLSGGEQQRVAIARALVKNPQIIFADEPTGNLDSENSVVIMDILAEHSKDKIVILVTHDLDLLHYGDHHYQMIDGTLQNDIKGDNRCSK